MACSIFVTMIRLKTEEIMSRAASGINVTALRVLRLARLLRILSGWAKQGFRFSQGVYKGF